MYDVQLQKSNKPVYLNIVDYINKQRFPLHDIPDSYGQIPDYFLDPTTCGPIRQSLYGETGCGNFTIADMISMYNNNVQFTFSREKDVFEIGYYLANYVSYMLENKEELDKSTLIYIDKSSKFLERVNKVCKKIIRRRDFKKTDLSAIIHNSIR